MAITIQKAMATDAVQILDYLKQIGSETDNLTFGSEGLSMSVEDEEIYINQMANSHDDILLIAKEDGKIIGSASLQRLPRRMSHRGDFSISVVKEYWNKGSGSKLLREIIQFAKENDFEIIDLEVRADNSAAIHLYKKFGFKKICTYTDYFKIGSEYVDFDYMCLRL